MSRRTIFVLAISMVMVLAFAGVAWAQTPVATETPAATATETATEAITATETTTATTVTGCPYGDFVDEDGDGVCDNREDGAAGQQWGPGAGAGGMGNMMGNMVGNMMRGGMMHGMMQMGQNFVDADEDGICDNCEDGNCMHQGQAARQGKMGMGRWGATDDTDDSTMGRGMRNSMGRGMNNMGRGWNR